MLKFNVYILFSFYFFLFYSAILLPQNHEWINYFNGDIITAIEVDGNFIWVATSGGGLVKIEKSDGSPTFYNKINSDLPSNEVACIAIDGSGNKWIGTRDGLAKFDGSNWTIYNKSNSGLPDNNVHCIVIDNSGNKWIGTGGGGLAKFDNSNWTVYNTSNSDLPNDWINCINLDGTHNKWIGTRGGLSLFDDFS